MPGPDHPHPSDMTPPGSPLREEQNSKGSRGGMKEDEI